MRCEVALVVDDEHRRDRAPSSLPVSGELDHIGGDVGHAPFGVALKALAAPAVQQPLDLDERLTAARQVPVPATQ